jgi:hypothetical protein
VDSVEKTLEKTLGESRGNPKLVFGCARYCEPFIDNFIGDFGDPRFILLGLGSDGLGRRTSA